MLIYLTVNNILFAIEKLSLCVMVISILGIVIVLFTPRSWSLEILDTVHCQGDDDDSLKKGVVYTLNEVRNTMNNLSNEGVTHTVRLEPDIKTVIDSL